MERWLTITQHPAYEVSDEGRVRSIDRTVGRRHYKGRVLKPYMDESGRLHVNLSTAGNLTCHQVHRLVALAFLPNPRELPQVNHKDTDPSNCKLSNLEWIGAVANNQHYASSAKQAALHGPVVVVPAWRRSVQSQKYYTNGVWRKP